MARIFDLGATLSRHSYSYNSSGKTPEQLDAEAIWSDWVMVGRDIQAVYDDMSGCNARAGAK